MARLLLAHCGKRGLYTMIRSHEVNIHHRLHLSRGKEVDGASASNTCTCYYEVDTPKGFGSFSHQCLYLLLVRDIRWDT